MRPPMVPCHKVEGRRRYVFAFQEFPGGGNRARKIGTSVHIPRQRLLTQLAHVPPTDVPPPVLKLNGTPSLQNFSGFLALLARDSCHDSVELRGGHDDLN